MMGDPKYQDDINHFLKWLEAEDDNIVRYNEACNGNSPRDIINGHFAVDTLDTLIILDRFLKDQELTLELNNGIVTLRRKL